MDSTTTSHRIFDRNNNFLKNLEITKPNLVEILYIGLVALLCLVGFIFSIEMVVYTIYCLLTVIVCLFSAKLELFVYTVPFMYIMPSVNNNPALNSESIFSYASNIIYLVVLALIMLAFVFYRVIRDHRGRRLHMPKLTFGFAILGLAYVLSGFGSGYQTFSNFVCALAEILSLCLMYFVGVLAIDWKQATKSGFAWMGLFVGLVVVFEVAFIYISQDRDILEIAYSRGSIYTGWGMYNNIGGYLIMTIPCAFYLACTERQSWLYILFGVLLYGGVMLTTSRGAMLTGAGILGLSCIAAIVFAQSKFQRQQIVVSLILLASFAVIAADILLANESVTSIIDKLIALKDSNRFNIYKQGLEQFKNYPIFGAGFYECDVYIFGNVEIAIPPRWHNTIVQLLATGGIVCLTAYVIHRAQTVVLVVKKHTAESIFIGLCILAIMISSLVDNHLFNFGPGFLYGAYLAFAEGLPDKKKSKSK